ncbi:BsaA family SipW-dependent biofilm matrix protein [Enterococcus wangshanyuanii]|uniref:Alternate signal-mediated exported protein, CPF_0494 family n=1 Tax=Enterococcus wangshanyuanii TaxID=2005703 RepID=A0ABQ1PTC1_9ENTE|nr:BsaA family SipW-dependent biofilm matrix protein [Enterococcus wangshanyuanii]GGD03009.1 hypothetical protein GCM10011573_35610 [Enterococcus wangshanyuanii]
MIVKKNKKKWLVAASTFAAMAALLGTFAWFTSQDSATNHFEGEIAGNDTEILETFTPPKDWKPGQDINKDVAVLNSGNYDSMIRVSFQELVTKLNDASAKLSADGTILNGKTEEQTYLFKLNDSTTATGTWVDSKITPEKTISVTGGDYAGNYTLKAKEQAVTTEAGTTFKYVSYWDNGTSKYYAKVGSYSRNDATNEITPSTAEFKYVDLASTQTPADWTNPLYQPTISIDANGKATIDANSDSKIKLHFVNLSETPTPNKWYFNKADATFYYVGIVKAQAQTAQLLDSVQLDSSAGMEYSKLKFDLVVNAKGIQAAKEAVNSTDWVNNTNTELKTALEGLY